MNSRFDYSILHAIENAIRTVKASPLMLGGVAGSGGGAGGPPGGIVGYLPQTNVSYDMSEVSSSGTPASGMSLLDNLNHIRYRLDYIEVSGMGGASIFTDLTDVPASYTGHAGKALIVSDTEDGVTFSGIHNPVTIGTANGLSLATQVLSLGVASSGAAGALSMADWIAFDNKIDSNSPITPATKAKITYDADGLVTAGADADISDVIGLQAIIDAMGGGSIPFYVEGALAVVADAAPAILVTGDMVVDAWYISCSTPGSGGSTIVDIHKNGTTIFTTQSNRPELAYNDANYWAVSGTPDVTDFVEGDILSLHIDTIASGAGGLSVVPKLSMGGGGFDATIVYKSYYDTQSILAAVVDNVPEALTIPEQTMVGRKTGGDITALTVGEILTLALSNTFPENVSITLSGMMSADGKYSGITISGIAGDTIQFGDVCYLSDVDSRWELADATVVGTAKGKLGMCVLAAAGDGSETLMLTYGNVRADASFPTLTLNNPVFLSTTPGSVQMASPSTTGNIMRVVGHANYSVELFFNPSPDFFEIA